MQRESPRSKDALRREMLAARRRIPPDIRRQWSAAICVEVCRSTAFGRAAHFVAYAPMGAEVDPADAAATALRTGKRLYYPDAATDGAQAFRACREVGGDERSRETSADALDPAAEGVLVLVPGVAFDSSGNRLGRGRGWYDRVLSRFERAHRVGLAFDLQVIGEVPREPWDIPMDSVVTPTAWLRPGRSFEPSEGTPRC